MKSQKKNKAPHTNPPRSRGGNRAAFTLAEVLITLGIIGVVAAMTIPTLMANIQKQQTVVKLKKAYAEISQALKLAEVEYDSIVGWNFADFETSAERLDYFTKNYLFPNMKIANSCIPSSSTCWSGNVKTLDGNVYNELINDSQGDGSFVSMSGYSVFYWLNRSGSGGWFFIDINGNRQPNVLGKDVFVFAMVFGYQGGFYPKGLEYYGVTRDSLINGNISGWTDEVYQNKNGCKKGAGAYAGLLCAALISQDGWTISKDYPW